MRPEILNDLVLAQLHALQADSGGSGREAVVNGYSAIDMALSALLRTKQRRVIKEHDRKLRTCLELFPNVPEQAGTSSEELKDLLVKWLRVRYQDMPVSPREGLEVIRLMHSMVQVILEMVCAQEAEDLETVQEDIQIALLGSSEPVVQEAVGQAHESIQLQLEVWAEESDGSRLGAKLLNSSNF